MSIYQEGLILPFTCLVTNLRRSKKQSEIEMTQILKQIIQLKNTSTLKTKQQVLEQLQNSKSKLNLLKEKLLLEKNQQIQMYNICRKRVHLDKQIISKNKQSQKQLGREFDREVIQFCCCQQKIKQAKTIQKSVIGCQQLQIQVKLYQKAFKIADCIQKNDLRPLKDWCYEHSHYLAKIQNPLQFKLICCSFINILNNIDGPKAVEFLRKQVSTLILTEHNKQQLNKLIYLVLTKENAQDYQYYSDSQKQASEHHQSKNPLNTDPQKTSLQPPKDHTKNDHEIPPGEQSLFVSPNTNSNAKNTEVIDQLGEGTEQNKKQSGTVRTEIKSPTEQLYLQQRQNIFQQPQDQQMYNHQLFQSISSESLQDKQQSNKQMIQEDIKIQNQGIQQIIHTKTEHFQIDEENQKYYNEKQKLKQIKLQIKKIIQKKHRLDKNNLREQLKQTKQQFIRAFSKIYQLSFDTFFDKTLAIGISIIKTPHCSESFPNNKITRCRGNCPTCTKQVSKIMKKIPSTMKNQSSLICRINGSLMNQINYPVALPSKQIYSLTGLQQTEKQGKYYCIAENKWYRKQQCRKVYLT